MGDSIGRGRPAYQAKAIQRRVAEQKLEEIRESHCSACGSTDPENVDYRAVEGYSACCNEPINWGCEDNCNHQEDYGV